MFQHTDIDFEFGSQPQLMSDNSLILLSGISSLVNSAKLQPESLRNNLCMKYVERTV
jgi:hypothetical protein